ncbi:MAG TPA: SAM-dependent methyltransferase [Candidatus Nanoarchaeia archaeon]|nr:SAM-dependent methyltransferase [Candidatus Nanoarchaeia archaeon]
MVPVSRAYEKLKFAIEKFNLDIKDKICADFGSSTGGFVQVLLEKGCKKVYSVETSKNRLHFVLKDDKRTIILDQTNAVHVTLPEKIDFISIDVGWTKQKLIIPNAVKNLKDDGLIISLIKPHYEIEKKEVKDSELPGILKKIKGEIKDYVKVIEIVESPIVGKKGGNKEFLMLCKKKN